MEGNEVEQVPVEEQVRPQEVRLCPHDGTELAPGLHNGGDMLVQVCPSCGTHFTDEELKRRANA